MTKERISQKEFEFDLYTNKIPSINHQIKNLTGKYDNLIRKLNRLSASNQKQMEPDRKVSTKNMYDSVKKSKERVKKIYESLDDQHISIDIEDMKKSEYYDALLGGQFLKLETLKKSNIK